MRNIYCGDYTVLTTTRWGAKIYVDSRDTSLAPHIMIEGLWEPWVSDAMAKVLTENKGATFIDVGANVGWYTLLACSRGAGRVFAFEPNPRMCELLKKTIAVNGLRDQVRLTEAACGAMLGMMDLSVDPTEAGGGHLAPWSGDIPGRPLDTYCRVVRLDDSVLPPGFDTMVDAPSTIVMKVDVEGYEPEVLAGATRLIALHPILFLEHQKAKAHEQMYARLGLSGYTLHHATHSGHRGPALPLAEIMALGSAETVICLPPGYAEAHP